MKLMSLFGIDFNNYDDEIGRLTQENRVVFSLLDIKADEQVYLKIDETNLHKFKFKIL